MTQFARPTLAAATDDGITLSTKFNGAMPALYTNHAGAAAPPSPEKGQMWVDTSAEVAATPILTLRQFTGSVWQEVGALNLTTGLFTTAGGLPLTGGTVSGPILFPFGTVAAPSVSFAGSTNVGMFRRGVGQLGFSAGGVEALWLGNTTAQFPVGTVGMTGPANQANLNIDRTTMTSGWSQINFRAGTSNRWQVRVDGAEGTGNAGSNFGLVMSDDAGASIVNYLQIGRASRQMGINGAAVGTAVVGIRSSDNSVVAWDGLELMNTSTTADAYAGISLRTASGALRAAIRGERPGAANTGDLGVWTARTAGSLTRAATFRANGNLEVAGAVQAGQGVSFGDSAPWTTHRWRWRFDAIGGIGGLVVNLNDADFGYVVWASNIIQVSLGSGVMNIADNVGGFWSVSLNPSDRRLKENVEPSTVDALADILRIPTFQFDWKRDAFGPVGDTDVAKPPQPIGLITDTLPEDCVNKNGTYEGVNLLPVVARLVKGMQQQQEIISSLESRLAALEGKL